MLTNHSQSAALVSLFHKGTKLRYAKGEFIFRPGGAPPGVFYVAEGLVKAYDITKYGEENLLIIRKPGELMCLTWALKGDDRGIIYSALSPTTLYQISRDELFQAMQANSELVFPLLDMAIEMYRQSSKRVITLEYRTVRERLISFLLSIAERFGQETKDGLVISVPLRHQDIASSISATRETTGRELAALERLGLLQSGQSIITLKNMPKLRSYLE